jgi:hypothetical protein
MAPVVGHQTWRDLLFLHWEVPPAALRPLVPAALELDLYEGRAYVGVIPFVVTQTRLRFLPPLPGLSRFYEVNTRTYVRRTQRPASSGTTEADETGGVWFFALDASNLAAVAGARAAWQLPYFSCTARLSHDPRDGSVLRFRSSRQAPGPTPATLDAEFRVHEDLGTAAPGTLEHFLIERYLLYTDWRPAGLMVGQVHHHPYPLRRAELLRLDCETLARSLGLPPPTGDVHAIYSPGVNADIIALRLP